MEGEYKGVMAAAAKGEKFAQLMLGLVYFHGQGIAIDIEKAKKWFRLAANRCSSINLLN